MRSEALAVKQDACMHTTMQCTNYNCLTLILLKRSPECSKDSQRVRHTPRRLSLQSQVQTFMFTRKPEMLASRWACTYNSQTLADR